MRIPENYVLLGSLGRTFQLAGALRFYPLGDAEATALARLKRVFVEQVGDVAVVRVREVGKQQVIYLLGFDTIDRARPLVNRDVYAPADALPESETHYLDLLYDLPVFLDSEPLGKVTGVLSADSALGQDVLIVARAPYGTEVLIPLQAPFVEVGEKAITLTNPPEGLLELNEER